MSALQPPPATLLDKYRGQSFLPLYATCVRVDGGETGHGRASGRARSDDGALAVDLRLPAVLGGPGGGTNPEQLFTAGYAACFHGALVLLATKSGVPASDADVEVTVTFGRDPADGRFALTADLVVHLPGAERSVAETLVRETERLCPYTKMIRQGVVGTVTVATDPAVEPLPPSGDRS